MVVRCFALIALVGCGRFGFDSLSDDDQTPPQDVAPATDGELADLLAGCELRLKMDESAWNGQDTVLDACGGDHPGSAINATTTMDPERGRVGEFVGGTSCVQIADHPALRGGAGFSISAWIKPSELTSSSFGIISKRIDFQVDTAYSLFVWDNATGENRLHVDVEGEDTRFELPTDNFLGTWRHVAMVFDGTRPQSTRIRLFVDGSFRAFAPEVATTISVPQIPPVVSIGCLPLGGPAQAMIGLIDDVVYWSRPLDDSEITAWYDATR